MKIRDILGNLEGVTTHVAAGEDVEITRGFVGDLLSFVMGSAPEKALWVTIQNHVNVAAVALLKEVPLVLLASGRVPSLELKDQCHKEGDVYKRQGEPLEPTGTLRHPKGCLLYTSRCV